LEKALKLTQCCGGDCPFEYLIKLKKSFIVYIFRMVVCRIFYRILRIGRQIFDHCRIRFEQWLIFRIQETFPFLVTYL
uniref:Uncharacterized protein n=1 Tax=Romanomermis culicivorax TaxID=13658 RepID=A0A915HF99_ROMCU